MRVVILSTDPGIAFGGPKGAAVHLAEVAGALAHRGAAVLLLVAGIAPVARAPTGVTLERLPGPDKATARERLLGEATLRRWLELRLRAFRADALYERLALHTAAGASAAARLSIPYLVELNAPLPIEAATYRTLDEPDAAERLECATLTAADRVFAVSRPLAAYARARGAVSVEVMPNAVAIDRYPERASFAARASIDADGDRPRAVFVGSLRPWHGIGTIARAWEELGPTAPELIVVGDGPGRDRLAAIGASAIGSVDHEAVPGLLARADIGIAPYASDAPAYFSPLKLFEYLASGLAVIAGAIPGVTDVLTPETALLIPPGDATALADGVRTLVANPVLRSSLGRAGRALVLEQHTWDRRAERVIAVIEELARAKRTASFAPVGVGG